MKDTSKRRGVPRDAAFRPHDQAAIALAVGQLDDQLRRLEATVAGLDVAALERQPGPGRNSVGMLLAHIGMTEVFWMGVATGRTPQRASTDAHCRGVIGLGLDDDGMPLAPGGGHPACLAGWDLARYTDLIHRARRYLKSEAVAWRDADLAGYAAYEQHEYTREWVLYHLLEHFAYHFGQIGLVLAITRKAS